MILHCALVRLRIDVHFGETFFICISFPPVGFVSLAFELICRSHCQGSGIMLGTESAIAAGSLSVADSVALKEAQSFNKFTKESLEAIVKTKTKVLLSAESSL